MVELYLLGYLGAGGGVDWPFGSEDGFMSGLSGFGGGVGRECYWGWTVWGCSGFNGCIGVGIDYCGYLSGLNDF